MSTAAKKAWARVCAFAWIREEVLKDLRKDPRGTIEKIARGENGADDETIQAATTIVNLSRNPNDRYDGYLPIPDPVGGLDRLDKEELKALLQNGITGGFRFDEKAELWADALSQAWKDNNLLKEIRKDPGKLPNADKLQESTYGIFPMPGLPRGLDDLKIEQLEDFLSDEDNARNLGGIFPPAF